MRRTIASAVLCLAGCGQTEAEGPTPPSGVLTGYGPVDHDKLPAAAWVDVTSAFGFASHSSKIIHGYCAIGADLDGDGHDDLLTVQGKMTAVAVDVALLGNGAPQHVLSPFVGSVTQEDVGCAAADLDDDGLLDLLYGTTAGIIYLHNDGHGSFSDQTTLILPPIMDFSMASAAWADFDGDGQNEIMVGTGTIDGQCGAFQCKYSATDYMCSFTHPQAASSAVRDRVFAKIEGQWSDQTDNWALPTGGLLTEVTAADINQDGAIDALIGNDFGDHYLLLHEAGGLKKYGANIGMHPYAHHMGWAVGDLDGDGRLDLVAGDLGPGILYLQTKPKTGLPIAFEDKASAWGIAAPTRDASVWDPILADFDQDGWLDLYLGVAAQMPPGGLPQLVMCKTVLPAVPQRDLYFRNQGGRGLAAFTTPADVGHSIGMTSTAQTPVDIDGDGDLDLLQIHRDGSLRVLRNDLASPGTSVVVRLRGKPGNRAAIGARLTATVAGRKLTRQMIGNSGFGGTGQWSIHFGLGGSAQVDQLEILWPGGGTSRLGPIAAGKTVTATAP